MKTAITYSRTIISFLILLLSYPPTGNAGPISKEIRQDVKAFMQLLQKNTTPTLADYQKFYGYSDVEELQFQWKACEAKGQTPPLQNSDCYRETVLRWAKKNGSPSLYLAWLRTKLPANPQADIKSVKRVGGKGSLAGDRISVRLNKKINVVFWRPAKQDSKQDPISAYGRLTLTEIGGVPIAKLRQQDSNSSVLIALGQKTLVRPLTQAELAEQEKQRKARCAADPECTKRMAENEKRKAEHEKEQAVRQRVGKTYRSWCEADTDACDKQKARRTELLGLREQLQVQCNKDYKGCIKDVENWLMAQRDAIKVFCDKYSKDCDALETLRRKHAAEQKAWCEKKPRDCAKSITGFDKAVIQARLATAK